MKIDRISAFSFDNKGGNPAGVVLTEKMPTNNEMLKIAKEVNYSETAFLVKEGNSFRIRYFSPNTEIAFCGHATIASGKVLGETFGEGIYNLVLNDGNIKLNVEKKDGEYLCSFSSLKTFTKNIDFEVAKELLEIFNLEVDDLDSRFPIKVSNSGNNHPIIFLNSREKLANMNYDFEKAKEFMTKENFTTISLLYCENKFLYHSRNAFAFGGVYEDPATGSAAVALAEYLRDLKYLEEGKIEILQGFDMEQPSKLYATFKSDLNSPISVSGQTRIIKE